MTIQMITPTTDTSKTYLLFYCPFSNSHSFRSRNSKNSEDDPTSQESEATPPLPSDRDLREEGNLLFNQGKYQQAIQKYEEAVRSGRCGLEDKVKCLR